MLAQNHNKNIQKVPNSKSQSENKLHSLQKAIHYLGAVPTINLKLVRRLYLAGSDNAQVLLQKDEARLQ